MKTNVPQDLHQVDPPVYSVLDVTDEVVDAFSQSFSPFLLLERLGDRKPSAESGLNRHKLTLSSTLFHVCQFGMFSKSSE